MKTKPSAWMPLYVGDYLRDTAHLSTSEHGAYFLMLMHAWTHGGELPGDGPRLCIITKMSAKDWRHSGDILMAFFQRHGAMLRHNVKVAREFAGVPPVLTEKHKVLQILVNLIRNAKYACDESGRSDKQITLRVSRGADCVKVAVIDNGVGIPPENLERIFNHGFTTRKEGHGFGLHTSANAAKEMGGALLVSSAGLGHGAEFTLELPLTREKSAL